MATQKPKKETQDSRLEKLDRTKKEIRARVEDTMEIVPVPANAPEIDW